MVSQQKNRVFHKKKNIIHVKKGTLKIEFVNFAGFSTKSVPD